MKNALLGVVNLECAYKISKTIDETYSNDKLFISYSRNQKLILPVMRNIINRNKKVVVLYLDTLAERVRVFMSSIL